MEKEVFIEKMNIVLNFIKEREKLEKAISDISDGYTVLTIGGDLVLTIIDFIEESLNIKGKGWLSWWLWEHVDKVAYIDNKRVDVSTLDKLYDFLNEGMDR